MDPKEGDISERMVLRGPHGYYIGTTQFVNGDWWPHSRDSKETWEDLGQAVFALATGDWTFTSAYGGTW
jgi:hypothetical protein